MDVNTSGLCGLAFSAESVDGVVPPFVNMINQNLVSDAIFSVYFSSVNNSDNSEIIFGGVDKSKYTGDIHYVPLSTETYWQIQIDNIKANGVSFGKTHTGIVDTGTSLLVCPTVDLLSFAKIAKAKFSKDVGLYTVDCSTISSLPTLTFVLHGVNYDLNGADYTISFSQPNLPDVCVLAMQAMDQPGNEMWILGDVFIRKYYSIFDYGNLRMGFAESV